MSLTCAQIISDALTISKCPGMRAQGGRAMNFVLDDLSRNRNLKINLVTDTIPVTANFNGPFVLESDYLRTYNLFYYINDQPYFLRASSLGEFDAQPNKSTTANYPYLWASDLSQVGQGLPGNLYIYPQSNQGLNLIHRYFVNRPDILTPESSVTTPWFPDQDYLVEAIAARMMRITDDSRYAQFVQECEAMLLKHLLTQGDEQQVVKEVQLDPRRFGSGIKLAPTKTQPY